MKKVLVETHDGVGAVIFNDDAKRNALKTLIDKFIDVARAIAANSPLSISVVKEQMGILGNAHPLSPKTFERIHSLRQAVFDSQDYAEGVRAIRENRQPVFAGR